MKEIDLTATKKGTILDVFYISVMFISIMVGIVVVYYTFNAFYAATAPVFPAPAMAPQTNALATIVNFDNLMLFIIVGVNIGCIISAFAVRTHPVFFVMFIILQALLVALTPMLQSIWTAVIATPSLASAAAMFPYFALIMNNYPVIVLVGSILVGLAMFLFGGRD